MTTSNPLLRTGALGAIAGGLLFAVWGYLHQDNAPLYFNTIAHILAGIVPALFMVGLATLWIQCAPRATRLVHTGIIVAFIGSTLGVIRSLVDIAVPSLYPHNALSGRVLTVLDVWTLTLFVGLLLAGVALVGTRTLRADRLRTEHKVVRSCSRVGSAEVGAGGGLRPPDPVSRRRSDVSGRALPCWSKGVSQQAVVFGTRGST